MSEVPRPLIPILKLNISQIGLFADDQFDTTDMQASDVFPAKVPDLFVDDVRQFFRLVR